MNEIMKVFQQGATQQIDCTADLLLVFAWYETASGTARSNIENGMECTFSVLLLIVPEAVLSHTKTRSRSAVHCAVHSQSCSSLSQRQSRPIQKVKSISLPGSPYGENCVRDGCL